MSDPTTLNYAAEYSRELANAYPYVLNFGALYATPNNGRYRMGEDGKTIYIPRLTTTGRVDSSRDTIAMATRNYDNSWEPKTLSHQRKWSTLVHPKDIDQTNMVTSIANITQVFNEEHKFPEMDAYLISRLYSLWSSTDSTDASKTEMTADDTDLTVANVLSVFDRLMLKMDEARIPVNGRLLYVPYTVRTLLKRASDIGRSLSVTDNNGSIDRRVSRLDEVQVIGVPSELMKTAYTFTTDWAVDTVNAEQINMFLVHPGSVITPVSYEMVSLDPPSAVTEGKWIYFEESFEDVFILNKKQAGLQFNVSAVVDPVDEGDEENPLTADSSLSELTIGNLALTPSFDSEVTAYTVTTSNAQNKVTATPTNADATVEITVGATPIENASSPTWAEGENTLTITVTNGAASTTYTVTVTKE